MNVRKLVHDDFQAWKILRLEALQDAPEAFGSSFEEEKAWSDAQFMGIMKDNVIFGAFVENKLIGMAAFYCGCTNKTRHKSNLWGMYVQSAYRKQGCAGKLLDAVISHAKNHAEQLLLTVVTTNESGVHLYRKFGFEIYGTEPHALKIADQYYDEHLMILKLG
jgi:ribosomal protein S18 acetylase RimI-like enzyme